MGRILDLFINKYNYTDFHELNLDWIISDMRTLAETLENFISLNTIKYADPIQWDITAQYESNTVVIDPNNGTAYLSVQPVPSGVALSNTDYWTEIFSLSNIISNINSNLTTHQETGTTSTSNYSVDDWVLWNDALYIVISPITAGDAFVEGSNIESKSVEEIVKAYVSNLLTSINNIINDIGTLSNLTTTDKSNIVAAINEIVSNVGNLSNLPTTDKSDIVSSINEIYNSLAVEIQNRIDDVTALNNRIDNLRTGLYVSVKDYGAVGDGVTDDSAAFQDCIDNEQFIFIPSGNYILKNVKLRSHIKIMGLKDSILYLAPHLTSNDVIGQVSTGLFSVDMASILYGDDITDIELFGFTLNGNPSNRSGDALVDAENLWIYHSTDINIHDMSFYDSLESSCHLYDCQRGFIKNCYFEGSGRGIENYPLQTSKGGDNLLLHWNTRNFTISNIISRAAHNIHIELEGRGLTAWDYQAAIKLVTLNNIIAREGRGHGFLFLNARGCTATNCITAGSTMYKGFAFVGGDENVLSNAVSINDTSYSLSIGDESDDPNTAGMNIPAPSHIKVDNFIAWQTEGIDLRNATDCTLSNITINANKYAKSNYALWIYGGSKHAFSNIKFISNANITEGLHVQGAGEMYFTNLFGSASQYLVGIASCSRMIFNILTSRYGSRGVNISGTNNGIVLNNVTEIQTTSDITTAYGSDATVHIHAATVLS